MTREQLEEAARQAVDFYTCERTAAGLVFRTEDRGPRRGRDGRALYNLGQALVATGARVTARRGVDLLVEVADG